jgi:hypothetical protein
MRPPRDSAPRSAGPALRPRLCRACSVLALLPICLLCAGCGTRAPSPRDAPALLVGRRGGSVAASQLARRFAAAYARGAYRRRPPRLPGATAAVRRALALAAARVPRSRRRLRPRLLALVLAPQAHGGLSASARIDDGHTPPFSVGFTVARRGAGWRVTAISPPG